MKKRILMIVLILLLIASGTITLIIINKLNKKSVVETEEQLGDVETEYKRESVINSTVFYTVEDCINTYIEAVKEGKKEKIIKLLDLEYITENNINEDNVLNYIGKQKTAFIALKMYESELYNVCSYIVEGIADDEKLNTKIFYRVKLDTNNYTFSIIPLSSKKYNNIDEVEDSENMEEIQNNDENSFDYNRIKDDEEISKYFTYYCKLAINNTKKAYEMLEKDYKDKRFNQYSKFEDYIKKQAKNLKEVEVAGYYVTKQEDSKIYTIVDQNGNVYIFNKKAPMNFTVQLDDYTLESEENKEKYLNSYNVDKVKLNVNKFIEMLANYDYESAYELLNETYKNNNFKTLNSYKKFLEQNFYNSNSYKIEKIETDAQDYIITISVREGASASTPAKKNKIAMRLGENTEFTMAVILNE